MQVICEWNKVIKDTKGTCYSVHIIWVSVLSRRLQKKALRTHAIIDKKTKADIFTFTLFNFVTVTETSLSYRNLTIFSRGLRVK